MEIDEKIKQEIRELLNRVTRADYNNEEISNFDYYINDPKELVTLKKELSELRKDAEKWRKVEEIAKRNELDSYPCEGCPVEDMCDSTISLCGQAESIVEALEVPHE